MGFPIDDAQEESAIGMVSGVVSDRHPAGRRSGSSGSTGSGGGKYQMASDEHFVDDQLAAPPVLGERRKR